MKSYQIYYALGFCAFLFVGVQSSGHAEKQDSTSVWLSFFKERPELLSALGNIKPVKISERRSEISVEENGMIYAIVSYKTREYQGSLMQKLCNSALVRSFLGLVYKNLNKKVSEEQVLQKSFEMASGDVRLSSVKSIGKRSFNGWQFQGCRTKTKDIKVKNITNREDYYIAKSSYDLAKIEIKNRKKNSALEFLKKTRIDDSVYNNAIGLIVPLVSLSSKDISNSLIDQFIKLEKMTDYESVAFLGEFFLREGDAYMAFSVFDRCLSLNSTSKTCQSGFEQAGILIEAKERDDLLDIGNFFILPDNNGE